MNQLYRVIGPAALAASLLIPASAVADRLSSPFSFFDGVTETVGTLKVIMHRPAATRSVGHGEIQPDGSLVLVQRVEDQGKPPHMRRWLIRQVAPGHFAGTMSEATGPVTIDQVGSRYRFRFAMKGGLSVEQWLTPMADGRSAKSDTTVHRFGITVASAEGIVRKIS